MKSILSLWLISLLVSLGAAGDYILPRVGSGAPTLITPGANGTVLQWQSGLITPLTLDTKGIRTFANSAAVSAGTPDYIGQLAVQLDNGGLYRGSTIAAGSWSAAHQVGVLTVDALVLSSGATISGLSGAMTISGALTATSFTGSGTGLTGTAAGLTAGNATLAAGLSGASTLATNGAASTPVLKFSGVPFAGTGTTSFPLVYINDANATASTTLNTAGTYFGVNGDGTQDLANFMKDGTGQFKIPGSGVWATVTTGNATNTGTLSAATINFNTGSRESISSPVDGVLKIMRNDGTTGSAITIGSTTVSGLPSAATSGAYSFACVTDALAFVAGSNVANGGSVKCMVQSNGTNWVMILQLY